MDGDLGFSGRPRGRAPQVKLTRVGALGAERPTFLDAHGVMRDLSSVVTDVGPAFFAADGLRQAKEAIDHGGLPQVSGRIGAPVDRPGKVVCIGLNYSDHAAETGQASQRPSWRTSVESWLRAGAPHHTVLSTAVGIDVLGDLPGNSASNS